MRGFEILNKTGKADLITKIKDELSNKQFERVSTNSYSIVFGAGKSNSELIVRQFLLAKSLGTEFNKSILLAISSSNKRIFHPLPYEWRCVLENHGFRADTWMNKLVWFRFLIFYFLVGTGTIILELLTSFKEYLKPGVSLKGDYVYFEGLNIANLPASYQKNRVSHDIITWYYRWTGRSNLIENILHNVQNVPSQKIGNVTIVSIPSAILPIKKIGKLLNFTIWGLGIFFICFIDLFRFQFWHVLLIREAVKAKQMRLQNPENIGREYLFNNSNYLLRPLWTYEAEKMGANIFLYFYSTNCETFKTKEGYTIQEYTWQVMNWPNYLVWDKYQADFVKRAVGERASNIHVVGPIWFNNSDKEVTSIKLKNYIAVFDVQPMRESRYQLLGHAIEYYIPSNVNKFLTDIAGAINGVIVFKRKRHISTQGSPWIRNVLSRKYIKLVESLSENENFITVDADVDAIRIIENSLAVISMPFTSTALIGKEMGKPSIYYDPNGQLQKDDRAAHGIPIVSGSEELNQWVANFFYQK